MANSFAYLVLFSWPLVVYVLFRLLPRHEALTWSIIGGYLALPFGVGINPPILPTFDKTLIPALSAAVMCFLGTGPVRSRPASADLSTTRASDPAGAAKARLTFTRPPRTGADAAPESVVQSRYPLILWFLLILLILTQFATYLSNANPYPIGPRVLPGLSLFDASSMIQNTLIMLLPFLLAGRYLGAPEHQVGLLRVLCVAGLLYSLPTLLEIRMSPQLARWTYGFLAQSFAQAVRDGGFRPVVFLQHGLWLAIFLAMSAMSAFALWRQERTTGRQSSWLLAGLWLCGVLLLSHSLGAFAILIVLAPIALLLPVRGLMLVAVMVAAIIVTYPMLRGTGLVPVDAAYGFASSISKERAQSLKFRFDNEDALLAHANERALAGWGGYARSRVFNPQTGADISVTDGAWIIVMGVSGWLGYVATFGLLAGPVALLFLRQRRVGLSLATAGLCLILVANLLDMLANATMTPVTWLIAGALAGRSRYLVTTANVSATPKLRSRSGAIRTA